MDFNNIKHEIAETLKQVNAAVKQWSKNTYYKGLQKQALMQAGQQQQYLARMQFDIQSELFAVMYNSHYPFLPQIYAPKNIRIHSYQSVGENYIFLYAVPVNTMPARTILDRLKDNINTDIYQYQQEIIYNYGLPDAMFNHPYIVSGLYVMDIQPLATDIIIKVVTNYCP